MFDLKTLSAIASGKMTLEQGIETFLKPGMMDAGHKTIILKLTPNEGKTFESKNKNDYSVVMETWVESFDEKMNEVKNNFIDLRNYTDNLEDEHREVITKYNKLVKKK